MPKHTTELFEALIEAQLQRLFRAAYRLAGNSEDAKDLVQDTCATALESSAALDRAEHPDRWLLRVLYNRFIDGSRRRKRSPVVFLREASLDSTPLAGGESGPEDLAERDDRERLLESAWLRLDTTQRALLSLRAEGYDLGEIEDITGIGRGVLRARLHRARQSLARHLEDQGDPAHPLPRLRRSQ